MTTTKSEPIPGLRDFIAVSALSVLSHPQGPSIPEEVAKYAYRVADAMLKERDIVPDTSKA
jgi:hypothetical protein